MRKQSLLKRIEVNPEIMLGKPVIKGTRLPAAMIVEKMAFGATIDDIIAQYPFLEKNDVNAALYYAARMMKSESIFAV
jgi:uncharacterized protein (DUF433 family)